jgi:hypothetical protein
LTAYLADSAANLKKSGSSKVLNILVLWPFKPSSVIKIHLSFVSHQPQGQNSTAAAAVDICGSAVLSQPQAKTERLSGLGVMHYSYSWILGGHLFLSFLCKHSISKPSE